MANVIKNIKVQWSWSGDTYSIRGFNIAITPSTSDPKGNVVAYATTDRNITAPYNYTFSHVTLDNSIQYTAWVQALYDGKDSNWVSTGNLVVTDDGTATIASKAYVDPTIVTVADMGLDGKVTPPEKVAIKRDWLNIVDEYPKVTAQADTYTGKGNIATKKTAYVNAYNALNTFLNDATTGLFVSMTTTTTLSPSTALTDSFKTYYSTKADLIKETTDVAKNLADTAQAKIDGLQVGGRNILRNSGYFNNASYWTIPSNAFTYSIGANKELIITKSVDISAIHTGVALTSTIQQGKKYTISAYVKTSVAGASVGFSLEASTGSFLSGFSTPLANADTYYLISNTFTATSNDVSAIKLSTSSSSMALNQSITIQWIKLEEGNTITTWIPCPEDVNDAIVNAQTGADTANSKIADMANDNKLTAMEKQEIKKEWDAIVAEKTTIESQATTYNITTEKTNFTSSYDTLNTYITPLLADLTTTSDITGSTLRTNFKNYYDKKAIVLKKISDIAKTLADTAQTSANSAQSSADTANSLINDMANDNKITALEKQAIKKEWDAIVAEKPTIETQGTTYSITTEKTNYTSSYDTLNTYITPLLASLTTTSDITGTTFRNNFKDYYDKRTLLLKKISEVAKTLADNAQTSANNAQSSANTAQSSADTANSKLAEMSNDNKLTPLEKQAIKKEWDAIVAEKPTIEGQATTYNLTTEKTNFTTSYNTLNTYITPLLADLTTTSDITGSTLRTNFKDYYDKKAILLKTISDTAKTLADTAQSTASAIQVGATNLLNKTGLVGDTHNLSNNVGTGVTTTLTFADETTAPTGRAITITRTDATSTGGGRYWVVATKPNSGKVITWSIWVKGSGTWNIGSEQGGQRSVTLTDTWTLYTNTFTTNTSTYYQFTFYRTSTDVGGSVSFHSLKMEEGNRSTSWTPSIKDTTDSITSAQSSADTANSLLADMSNDNKLTPIEKQDVKKEWDTIVAEKPTIESQATMYGVGTEKTNYTTSYDTLNTYITPLISSLSTTSDITGTTFRSNFKDYYDKRTLLLKKISDTAKTLADNAQSSANNAQTSANNAQTSANTANSLLGDIYSDNKFTPSEKQSIKREWDTIVSEKTNIEAQATTYNITTEKTDYTSAYNTLNSYITPLLSDLNTTSDIVGTTFRDNFKNYYDKKVLLLKKVSDVAKTLADNAQSTADNIKVGGRNMITGTRDYFGWTNGATSNVSLISDVYLGLTAFKTIANSYPNTMYYTMANGDFSFVSGGVYTVSCYAKCDTGTATIGITVSGGMVDYGSKTVDATWKRFVWTFTHDGGSLSLFRICALTGASSTNGVYICGIQVEEGNRVSNWKPAIEDIDSAIDTAQTSADTANSLLADIANDDKLTAVEKSNVKKEWDIIVAEKTTIETEATTYGITTEKTNFTSAYDTLNTYITPLLASLSTTSDIVGTTFRTNFKNYYDKKVILLKKISETAKSLADTAQTSANTAQTSANNAQTSANTANALLADISNDNKLTPSEKQDTKKEWDIIVAEKVTIEAQATTYNISTEKTNYVNSYNTLNTYITPLLSDLTTTSDITGTTFRTNFKDYYDKRAILLKKISDTAKSLVDTAQTTADGIQVGGRNRALGTDVPKVVTGFTGIVNYCPSMYTVLTDGLKTDNPVTVSFVFTYSGLTYSGSKSIYLQGAGNVTGWTNAWTTYSLTSLIDWVSGSGTINVKYTFNISSAQMTNASFALAMRCDYITGGTFTVSKFKIEQGNRATDWSPSTEDVNALISNAQTSADTANSLLADIANDNKLTALEKQMIKTEWDAIVLEKPTIDTQATTYGITTAKTNYDNSYSTLNTYITPLLSSLTTTSDIVGTTFRSNFADYYDKKATLLKAISDSAKSLADTAQTSANNAQTSANTANSLLSDMSNDNKLTPIEKQDIKKEWDIIVAEKVTIEAQATTYGVTTEKTNYTSSYDTLNTYVTPLLASLTTTSDIVGTTFRDNFKNYYDKRTILLKKIAELAKTLADTAQTSANTAQTSANNAQTSADTANNKINDMSNDNKLTSIEKQQAKKEWDIIVAEKTTIEAQATVFNITTEKTNYTNSYNTLNTYITPLITDLTVTSDIVGTTFRTNFKDYYDKKAILLKKISDSAKTLADNAQSSIDGLQIGATNLFRNSKNFESGWSAFTSTTNLNVVADSSVNNENVLKADNSNSDGIVAVSNAGQMISVVSGDTYTVSAKFKSNHSGTFFYVIKFRDASDVETNPLGEGGSVNASFGQWYNVPYTFTVPSTAVKMYITCRVRNTTGVFPTELYVYHPKLERGNKPTDWLPNPQDVDDLITTAQNSANTANSKISDMANDNKLTPLEKQDTKKEWDIIVAEKITIEAQATVFSTITTEKTNYVNSYNTLSTYITPLLSDLTTTSDISGVTFRSNFKDYYDKKAILLKKISDTAKGLADDAQTSADNAQTDADIANGKITDMASDSKLTPVEKTQLKREWDIIVAEKPTIEAQAVTYGITTEKTNFTTSYSTLNTYVTPLLSDLTTTSDITGTTLRNNFKDYYDKKTILIRKMGEVAKTLADNAQSSIDGLIIGSNNLVKNSSFEYGLRNWSNASSGLIYDVNNINTSIYNKHYLYTQNIDTAERYIYQLGIILKPSTQYTASFYYCNDMTGNASTGDFYVLGQKLATTGTAYDYVHHSGVLNNTSGAWVKKSYTFTTASDEVKCILRLDNNGSTAGAMRFGLVKLEEGNRPSDWTPNISDIGAGTIYCRGTGNNRNNTRILKIGETTIYNESTNRGLRLTVIDRNLLTVISDTSYDIYGDGTARTNLATALNALDDTVIVVLTSYDAINIDTNLASALSRCGGSGRTATYRNPYALIGIPAIGKGAGLEILNGTNATDPYAELSTKVENGFVQGINSINVGIMSNIDDLINDNKLTPAEKTSIKTELDNIVQEKPQLDAQADYYLITTEKTNYGNSYTTLYNYVNPLLSSMTTTSDITGTTLRSYFSDYYSKRATLLTKITNVSKVLATNVMTIDNRETTLFHFDDNLCSTEGNNPSNGYNVVLDSTKGKFGGAVWIEEGTANLLTTNNSFETDSNSDGVSDSWGVFVRGSGDATRTHTATRTSALYGSGYSQKLVITGGVSNGSESTVQSNVFTVSPNITYTLSAYVRSSNMEKMYVSMRWATSADAYISDSRSTAISATSDIVRITVTGTSPSTAGKCTIVIGGINLANEWFETDCVQMEQKGYATTFTSGTRSSSVLNYGDIGNYITTSKHTILMWVNSSSYGLATQSNWNMCFSTSSAFYMGWDTTSMFRVSLVDSADAQQALDYTGMTFTPDTWYLVGYTFDNGLVSMYINGNKVASRTITSTIKYKKSADSTQNLCIGTFFDASYYLMNGYVDEVLVSKRVYSDVEILAMYNAQKPFTDPQPTVYVPKPTTVTLTVQ